MPQDYKDNRIAEFRKKFAIAPYSLWRFGVDFTEAESFLSDTIDDCTAAAVAGERETLRKEIISLAAKCDLKNPYSLMLNVFALLTPPPSTTLSNDKV